MNKDVPPGTIVGGVPAKVIGDFEELHKKRKEYSDCIKEVKSAGKNINEYLWDEFQKKRENSNA